jgi:hypothetical protein
MNKNSNGSPRQPKGGRRVCYPSTAALVGVALLLTALATPGLAQASKKGEKAADSLKALAKEVQAGEAQVGAVTSTLDQLVNRQNKDLRKAYKAYDKEVKRLGDIASNARKRRDGLLANRESYLKAWDQDLAKIQNEDIRARSSDRRQKVQVELDKLAELAKKVGESYRAFEANVLDIQRALGADLTPGGVQAIAPVANEARKNAVPLRDSLNGLHQQLESLGVAMSAKAQK